MRKTIASDSIPAAAQEPSRQKESLLKSELLLVRRLLSRIFDHRPLLCSLQTLLRGDHTMIIIAQVRTL